MKKNLSEIVFLLDRSGSMSGLEKDTIGGFNAMIEKQKKEEKPESMIALIGVLGGAFAGAYLWLIILGGIL